MLQVLVIWRRVECGDDGDSNVEAQFYSRSYFTNKWWNFKSFRPFSIYNVENWVKDVLNDSRIKPTQLEIHEDRVRRDCDKPSWPNPEGYNECFNEGLTEVLSAILDCEDTHPCDYDSGTTDYESCLVPVDLIKRLKVLL